MNLELLWLCICLVESGGDPNAIGDNGKAFGIAQIHREVVDDWNKYHRLYWNMPEYRHIDCFNPDTSKEIFFWYIKRYCNGLRLGHEPTMEDAARIWNGGPNGFRKSTTIKYWKKIKKEVENGLKNTVDG